MDIYAYLVSQDQKIEEFITKSYGDVPRLRGCRFMKLEEPMEEEVMAAEIFNQYCGQDVIYICTRCGDCGVGYDDENSNYQYCGGEKWEQENKDCFITHCTDSYDRTYCDHYFKVKDWEEYNQILELIKPNQEIEE